APVGEDQDEPEEDGGDGAVEYLHVDEQLDEVAGDEGDEGADGDLPAEEPEEQRRLGEPAGHRPLHPDRLGQGVGGRERHHGGGQRRGAEQADGEEVGGGRAGGRLEGPGGVVGGRQGPVAADGGGGGDDDAHADEVGEDRPGHGVDPDRAVVVGPGA